MRGAARWAWFRSKSHRASFWAGGVIFGLLGAWASVATQLPRDPSWTQVAWNSAVGVVGAALVLGILLYVSALAVAPYQQRNALRSLVVDEAERRLFPELAIELGIDQYRRNWLRITNHGDRDKFRAFSRMAGGDPQDLAWDSWHSSENAGEAKELEKGAYGRLWPVGSRRPPLGSHDLEVTFLSALEPLKVHFTVRYTLLGAVEMKLPAEEWPPITDAWSYEVLALRERLVEADNKIAAGIDAWNDAAEVIRQSKVAGPDFFNNQTTIYMLRDAAPHSGAKEPESNERRTAAMRACIAGWVANLDAVLAEDRP